VPSSHWAWRLIEAIYGARITSGCAASPLRYCPTTTVTRAQMAVFLCRGARKDPLNRSTPTFSDVPTTHWAYGSIERLADRDSWGGNPPTSGCVRDNPATPENEARFCPEQPATRQQMAKFLCATAGRSGLAVNPPTFADVPGTNSYQPLVERLADRTSWCYGAVTSGCIAGPPPLYCPRNSVTRDQMAVFLVRALCSPR
jgi:hypothetical protein